MNKPWREALMILVTGAAGFIGFHLCYNLLKLDYEVVGIDNLNNYYDTSIKVKRNNILRTFDKYIFEFLDIKDKEGIRNIFRKYQPDYVVHLAAQAGVRYSFTNPDAYIESNIVGFFNILESCKLFKPKHLIFASSSSVYGNDSSVPFKINDCADKPISLYAATKRSNELMAFVYSNNFAISITGLRFFTVYGPWGRPDMAYYKFTKNIIENKEIEVYNNGELLRDFTYIDDVVHALIKVIFDSQKLKKDTYRLYNVGNSSPVRVIEMIEILEEIIGKKAKKIYKELQPGDVFQTYADTSDFERDFGFKPKTDLQTGLRKFVEWYIEYNRGDY